MTVSEQQARDALVAARPGKSAGWYQGAQAVARFEGGYGNAWKNGSVVVQGQTFTNAGEGSNNWGAVQCNASTTPGGTCPGGCFAHVDTHSNGSPYQGCFKQYATPAAGAADFLFVLTDNGATRNRASVDAALSTSPYVDADAVAIAMRASGYFEAPASTYAAAIVRNAAAIAQALGEAQLVFRGADLPGDGAGSGSPVAAAIGLAALFVYASK